MPNNEELSSLKRKVSLYTVTELEMLLTPYRKFVKQYHLYAVNTQGTKYYIPTIEKIAEGKNKLKKDLVEFYAIMRAPRNLNLLNDIMTKKQIELMRFVLRHIFVSKKDANRILGQTCMRKDNYYWATREYLTDTLRPFFTGVAGKGKNEDSKYRYQVTATYVVTYTDWQVDLMKLFFPELDHVEPLAELPKGDADALKVYSAEQTIFINIPMLKSLHDTNQIEFGKSKITATIQKKITKMLQPDEFFAPGDKTTDGLAANFLGNAFCLYASTHKTEKEKTEDLVKNILLANNRHAEFLTPFLLPHLSGFRRNQLAVSQISYLFNDILSALITLDGCGWIHIDQFIFKTATLGSGISHFKLMYADDFDKQTIFNNFNYEDVFLDRIVSDITWPLIKAYLFMMATLGLVEVAYSETSHHADKEATSYFDGLKYVQLTDLGRYALGRTQNYKRKELPKKALFELAEDSLLIRSLSDNNPYEAVLEGMAERISKNMYKVTNESFLRQCNEKKDIENNVSLFKEYVCKELPPVWESFFSQLLQRGKLITKPKTKYQLLQLPAADKELQRIVLGDPTLKKYTLKAENYLVLVEQDNYKKVCEALKKYGYLL